MGSTVVPDDKTVTRVQLLEMNMIVCEIKIARFIHVCFSGCKRGYSCFYFLFESGWIMLLSCPCCLSRYVEETLICSVMSVRIKIRFWIRLGISE